MNALGNLWRIIGQILHLVIGILNGEDELDSGGTCTMPKTIYPSTNMPLSIDYIRGYYSGGGVGTNVLYKYDGTVTNPNPGYSIP